MKNSKFITITFFLIGVLLLGVILGKGMIGRSPQKQAEIEYEKQRQIERTREGESHRRMVEDIRNMNETR